MFLLLFNTSITTKKHVRRIKINNCEFRLTLDVHFVHNPYLRNHAQDDETYFKIKEHDVISVTCFYYKALRIF